MNFSDVRFDSPAEQLFNPPDGFVMYKTPVALMNELIIRETTVGQRTEATGFENTAPPPRGANIYQPAGTGALRPWPTACERWITPWCNSACIADSACPPCPTYDATRIERHSPRGRIALMRAIADGRLEATRTFAEEMYFCLGCLACMTACPAGVNYAELFENARAEAEESGALRRPQRQFIRSLTMGWLFMDLRRLQLAALAIRFWQETGMQASSGAAACCALLPRRWRELEEMTPRMQPSFRPI